MLMDDIQDGKKVSIQNGVEEDPTLEEKFEIANKSFAGLIYMAKELTSPQVVTILQTSTDSEDFTSVIVTVLGTAVT